MFRYLFIGFLCVMILGDLSAQSKQDYVWLFGQDGELSGGFFGFKFDYNQPPMEVEVQDINYGLGKANASICDNEGNLLFYMNGCAVLNSEYQMMENGDSLGYDRFWEVFNNNCLLGIGSFQDHMVLGDPANEDEYYILHKPSLFNDFDEIDSIPLWYSKVDMTMDGGLGGVSEKNIEVDNTVRFLKSYLTAINHSNGKDWWVTLAPIEDSVIHTYLIDESGIQISSIQNSSVFFTRARTSASGTSKFSPDGTKYALYNYYNQLHIYDFDRTTGILSNHQQINVIDDPDYYKLVVGSLEWSPNSRFIYTSSADVLHQVDLWENNIQENGVRLIDIYNGTLDPFPTNFFIMAQAPDCKIYMAPTNGSYSFHVIHKPNELGTACNFVQNGLKLPFPSNGGGMPNFPRFRVDEEDKCDQSLTSVFGDAVYYRRDLTVYPSPSDGRYTVEMPDDFRSGTLTVINLDGQIVENKVVTAGTLSVSVDITSYPSGYYHVELYPEDNKERIFWSKQVLKQ